MAKFENAFSIKLDKEIAPFEYSKIGIHSVGDLECIECRNLKIDNPAKLHLKRRKKESGITYFYATNPKSSHHKKCRFYEKFTDTEIVELFQLESPSEDDLNKMNNLIEQNLLVAIRQNKSSLESEDKESCDENNADGKGTQKSHKKGVNKGRKKDYIEKVSINKINYDGDCFDRLVCIHGIVKINVSTLIKKSTTQEFKNKRVVFYNKNDKIAFSLLLGEYVARLLGLENDGFIENITFAIVGKLVIKTVNKVDYINCESFIGNYFTDREMIIEK
ncbi:hypothetical protein [Francisella frigiditurris]|uniref:Uncharacterized protein n=1 Tax=Francisella frigiditurris TaxID=1542390 RepID=A0A1J0KUE2_9GAMM|nr:hypothetical protein [Francisella frigiditurris]APC97408.1 hypothetical protein KX01_315 [Francisella frigiditurris]